MPPSTVPEVQQGSGNYGWPNSPEGATPEIVLRSFRPEDVGAFFQLNEAWISNWFTLEPEDLRMLHDPQTHILAQGGHIFVAELPSSRGADGQGDVVGCFALIPKADGALRLVRMAVRQDLRGRGVGRRLLQHAIHTARALHAPRITLETSSKLESAVHLYESAGFIYVPPDSHGPAPLARADLYMELPLCYG